jgi:hypothetical protein
MKFVSILLVCICASGSIWGQNQKDTQIDSIGFEERTIGKIQQIGETWLIISIENDRENRYVPINLKEEFQVDGIEIVFSGTIGANPPNVRVMGNPFEIKEARKLTRAQPKE